MRWKNPFAKKKTVRVAFVDAATGATFARAELDPSQLPESFARATTVQVEGKAWEVLSASATTRDEYVRRRELTLTLRKAAVQVMPPGEILYTLPTICDAIPAAVPGSRKPGANAFAIPEDDWRQVELLSATHAGVIDASFAEIEKVLLEGRAPEGGGFRTIHLRAEPGTPIAPGALSIRAVLAAFPEATRYDAVVYRETDGVLEGGFALRTHASIDVYGVVRGDDVACVGLALDEVSRDVEGDGARLAELLRAHDLVLVDWCGRQVTTGEARAVCDYLRGSAKEPSEPAG